MTFLPVLERELRVAARRPSTTRIRVLAALLALLIGAGFLTLGLALGSTRNVGAGLFSALSWLALAAALAAGMFLTSDSLSEEKREGTLGFLFLTELRGYEVVGGKLLATSLRGAYALLAIFPILALTLMMGGTTGMQLWRSSLALVNALFFSLAAGLLVSSVSRDAQRALAATLLLLLLICGGGPLMDGILAGMLRGSFRPWLSLSSPVYVFWGARAWGRTGYWLALAVSHALAWTIFALACWLAPRTWQIRPARFEGTSGPRSYVWRYGAGRWRTTRRARLMAQHPILWLVLRERWQTVGAWALAGVACCGCAAILLSLPAVAWVLWMQLSQLLVLLLYLWTAGHACRFLVDAKRSGLLELLLVTPLPSRDIVQGQWKALVRGFGAPALVLILTQTMGQIVWQWGILTTVGGTARAGMPGLALQSAGALLSTLALGGNLAALAWFGMWTALTSKSANLAILRTLLLVQVLPWLAIWFVSMMLAGLLSVRGFIAGPASGNTVAFSFPWLLAMISGVLTLGKDAAFIIWARQRVFANFRTEAARAQKPGKP